MKILSIILVMILIPMHALAATIITVPLDSRPISLEYLENLVNMGGDDFISVNKEYLDTNNELGYNIYKHGDSAQVRKNIEELVSTNNTTNSSVILNMSSYIHGGLVDGRQVKSEEEINTALNELDTLITTYDNPIYYVHINLPRVLPDSRATRIWPNKEVLEGLGFYYVSFNPDEGSNIEVFVTPEEFLLEWAYVENKKYELGEQSLYEWEKAFLSHFNENYLNNPIYQDYIKNYQAMFEQASYIAKDLITKTTEGKIDELIISTDDYQLPSVIQYLDEQDLILIPKNKQGDIIKFNFVRRYLEVEPESIYNFHKTLVGLSQSNDSKLGIGEKINYIFGTDEIPQLIYARDLAKRTGVSTNFLTVNTQYSEVTQDVGSYDVLSTQQLYNQRMNFVRCKSKMGYHFGVEVNSTPFQFYIKRYDKSQQTIDYSSINALISDMFTQYNSGVNIGLIELYNENIHLREERAVVSQLQDKQLLLEIGLEGNSITQLATYSAWNTEGNAIGLALAHAQVYGIVDSLPLSISKIEECGKWHYKILLQHLIEDNFYTAGIKADINFKDYYIYGDNTIYYDLLQDLEINDLLDAFSKNDYTTSLNEVPLDYDSFEIKSLLFPWNRIYDLYVDVEVE
ncbi:hypothetical protein AN639_07435 [Candidatus Epulonipiscium fishelsonii]|uniref:Uncharacterized protein n=1 Tax=Candidatus Epulonipiscium fishelsonii TaxID=77094 RepID=A0ACC8XF15_9FIRM|nr:hypothetical protein AN639_07435 [Epulopiscium sp. SCG-B05WGA-EpuloA1]ONI41905.1 hypothetical protein AN396_02935 [Epulopiscium sp. SCG-B11WGA-EpuloA1]